MARAPNLAGGAANGHAYHKGNVAEDLRAAAKRILATERLEDVTLRRLTREVGVTPANFYNHFKSLDELLLSIAAAGFDDLTARAAVIFSGPGSRTDLLAAAATECVAFCVRNKQLVRLMFRRADGEQYAEYPVATHRSFGSLVEFIYGEGSYQPASATEVHERYGIALGFLALWYGFAALTSEGLFELNVENESELGRFIKNSVRPFLDGSVVSLLEAADKARRDPIPSSDPQNRNRASMP